MQVGDFFKKVKLIISRATVQIDVLKLVYY